MAAHLVVIDRLLLERAAQAKRLGLLTEIHLLVEQRGAACLDLDLGRGALLDLGQDGAVCLDGELCSAAGRGMNDCVSMCRPSTTS